MMFRNVAGWMPFGMIGGVCMVFFIALIVVLIVIGVRSGRHHRHDCCPPPHGMPSHDMPHNAPPNMSGNSNAEQILKERLAKGEIDEAAYDNLLKKIRE